MSIRTTCATLAVLTLWAAPGVPAQAAPVTYNKDVAPIIHKNCASCHRPGEVGPFSLLTYKDAAKRAKFLAQVTASKQMPPWKAEPGHGDFLDAMVLTRAEIATFAAWAEAGAPEGDPKDARPAPTFTDGWQLGKPDLVLQMPEAFTVKADGRDVFRCFVLPTGLTEDRTVAAVEFRPGNRRVVHHALFFLDSTGQARRKDAADEGPGYSTFGGIGILPTGSLGGWAPGAMPRRLPDGLGKMLKKGSDLVLQVHYHPAGKEETDRSSIGIYFTKEKVAGSIATGIPLVNRKLYVPAGAERHKVTASFTVPVDLEAIGITPHMHLVGREMKVTAVFPDGKSQSLVWIKDWDFNWQNQYGYAKPVKLPKGTRLELEAYYDNSDKNPKNPSSPPKVVRWGEQTTDEMCLCGVQVVTKSQADRLQLFRATLASQGRLGMLFGGGD